MRGSQKFLTNTPDVGFAEGKHRAVVDGTDGSGADGGGSGAEVDGPAGPPVDGTMEGQEGSGGREHDLAHVQSSSDLVLSAVTDALMEGEAEGKAVPVKTDSMDSLGDEEHTEDVAGGGPGTPPEDTGTPPEDVVAAPTGDDGVPPLTDEKQMSIALADQQTEFFGYFQSMGSSAEESSGGNGGRRRTAEEEGPPQRSSEKIFRDWGGRSTDEEWPDGGPPVDKADGGIKEGDEKDHEQPKPEQSPVNSAVSSASRASAPAKSVLAVPKAPAKSAKPKRVVSFGGHEDPAADDFPALPRSPRGELVPPVNIAVAKPSAPDGGETNSQFFAKLGDTAKPVVISRPPMALSPRETVAESTKTGTTKVPDRTDSGLPSFSRLLRVEADLDEKKKAGKHVPMIAVVNTGEDHDKRHDLLDGYAGIHRPSAQHHAHGTGAPARIGSFRVSEAPATSGSSPGSTPGSSRGTPPSPGSMAHGLRKRQSVVGSSGSSRRSVSAITQLTADPDEDGDMFHADAQSCRGSMLFFKFVDSQAYQLYHKFRLWINKSYESSHKFFSFLVKQKLLLRTQMEEFYFGELDGDGKMNEVGRSSSSFVTCRKLCLIIQPHNLYMH